MVFYNAMTLEELMAESDKLNAEERERLMDYLGEKALGNEVQRRIDEADADPSIMISHEDVMKQIDGTLREISEARDLSPAGPE